MNDSCSEEKKSDEEEAAEEAIVQNETVTSATKEADNRTISDDDESREETNHKKKEGHFQKRQQKIDVGSSRRAWLRAHARSFFNIDHTKIAFVPPMRTAIIIMLEWTIMGIGNSKSTAFQLGCLYVGFTDPNGNLTVRIQHMGLTLISCVVVGALLPAYIWRIEPLIFFVAFIVAFFAGYSNIFGYPALSTGLKLGTTLFAINLGVLRSTNGYGGPSVLILWTFSGSSVSLLAACLPEIVGNRDAARTDLFKVWRGFGVNLKKWSSSWLTVKHLKEAPIPKITLAICKKVELIERDKTEDPKAKEWLLNIIDSVDTIRTYCLCLSTPNGEKELDALFRHVGRIADMLSFAFQFPWATRYNPWYIRRVRAEQKKVNASTDAIISKNATVSGLPTLVTMLREELQSVVDRTLDGSTWPRYSSPSTLPKRILAVFPKKIDRPSTDADRIVRSYSIRFAVAFSLATIPELLQEGSSTHWFPMTVALIMGSSEEATFTKVGQRTFGTLLGIGLGSALAPLFQYPAVLIILLGLNTFASCVFIEASYSAFTFFITAYVFCTTVGTGADQGITTFYRCLWTICAAVLVLAVTNLYREKYRYHVAGTLAATAQAIKVYAQAVLEQHTLRSQAEEIGVDNRGLLDVASKKVSQSRSKVIKARVNMLNCIHRAVLTPRKGELIDPHVVAPAVAANLVNAIVIPQFVSLVQDESADGLLEDFDDHTFSEIDRLAKRLEQQEPSFNDHLEEDKDETEANTKDSRHTNVQPNHASSTESIDDSTTFPRVPFSQAIASAHRVLDEAGVPDAKTGNDDHMRINA